MVTILVVDDHSVVQRVLSAQLRKGGFEVVTASSGQEALDRLEEQAIDLAITDIAMPEMDGLTLLKHLRSDQRYQALPIVMLTGSGQDEYGLAAKAEGANEFLTKPTSSRELIETVNRLLDQIAV